MPSSQLHRLLFTHVLAPPLPWSSPPLANFSFYIAISRSLSILSGSSQLHLHFLIGKALDWHRMSRTSPNSRPSVSSSPAGCTSTSSSPWTLAAPLRRLSFLQLLRSSFQKTRGNVAGWRPLTLCFLCLTITTTLLHYYSTIHTF